MPQLPRNPPVVKLRPVEPSDLERIYEMQSDEESNRLAVTYPRSREVFEAHWAAIFSNAQRKPNVILLQNTAGDAMSREGGPCETVGYISCFEMEGVNSVGYWIDRKFWGMGIATQALKLLLQNVCTRPIEARVATSNQASLRVLEKCGFKLVRTWLSPADDRYPECEEAILRVES